MWPKQGENGSVRTEKDSSKGLGKCKGARSGQNSQCGWNKALEEQEKLLVTPAIPLEPQRLS